MTIGASKKTQRGAAAIEMALVFTLFFGVFYAIVSYSLPMLMVQAFNHAAASGARAAVAIEPSAYANTASYINNGVIPRAREVAGETLDWLPAQAKTAVLGPNNNRIDVSYNASTNLLTVSVIYPNYATSPLVPTLRLPGLGDVPRLPQDLRGSASVGL